jgi:hypothetical protein
MTRPRKHPSRAENAVGRVEYRPLIGEFTWITGNRAGQRADKRHSLGYRVVRVNGQEVLAHRLAWRLMTGAWPAAMVDHINGRRDDNRWANLREADKSVNAQNQTRPMRTNTTGFLGVTIDRRRTTNPYRAEIVVRGRQVSLGAYSTPEEAYRAYLAAKARLHPGCALSLQASEFREPA